MKIAYLLGSLNRGGTETLLLDYFRHFEDAGFEMIAIYRKDGSLLNEFLETTVKLIKLKPRNIFDIGYLLKFRKLIRSEKIDIIHAQQPIDGLFAYLATIGSRKKVVLSLHAYYNRKSRWFNYLLKYIIKRSSLNIYVSESLKKNYLQRFALETEIQKVLYNGISFDKFSNILYKSIKEELNIPHDHILFGSVGNFNSVRDQLTLCRFIKLLNQQESNFSFLFAGAKNQAEPSYWENCINYCKDNDLNSKVFFLGSRKDIPNILNQLDAFIYASDHDTFGIAIIEAMYAGIPVFVNDWKVMLEITDGGKHGTIYKSKNEYDLLDKFNHYLNNNEQYLQKAKADAEWVRENYSINKHLNRLKELYTVLLT